MLNNIPKTGVAEFIKDLVKKHNIVYQRTNADAFADKATELAGDEIVTDEIDDLLVALKRIRVISNIELVELLGGHIDEFQTKYHKMVTLLDK